MFGHAGISRLGAATPITIDPNAPKQTPATQYISMDTANTLMWVGPTLLATAIGALVWKKQRVIGALVGGGGVGAFTLLVRSTLKGLE